MSFNLKIEVLRDLKAARQISLEWSELWGRCPHATTFQRPEWILAWMETFKPHHPLMLAVRQNARLVGVAPLLIYLESAERTLGLMGGGVSDYLDVLVDPICADQVLTALWNELEKNGGPWSAINFSDLPRTSTLLRSGFSFPDAKVEVHDVCPILPLPSGDGDMTDVVPSSQLRNLRNAQARLERKGGGQIEIATRDSLTPMLSAMFRLHGTRWAHAGEPGMLSDETIRSFHRRVAPDLLEKGILRLYGLRHQGEFISALYALCEKNVIFCYLQGFDPGFGFLSPGTQIVGAAIADAIREKKQHADFLRGGETYKYKWGACDQATFRIRARTVSRIPASSSRVAA